MHFLRLQNTQSEYIIEATKPKTGILNQGAKNMAKILKYPNIEAERARAGLTQDELCAQLHIARKTYYNWVVRGKIPINQIARLANILDVSADYLLGTAAAAKRQETNHGTDTTGIVARRDGA